MILSIIIPTQGRLTLKRALDSIRNKTQPFIKIIEIIVVADTHSPLQSNVAQLASSYRARYLEFDAGFHGFGHPQAEYAYPKAEGDYIMALGDDDQYVDGGLTKVVHFLEEDEEKEKSSISMWQVVMYKSPTRPIDRPWTVWYEKTLRIGTVTGQNICIPNIPEILVPYPSTPVGDRTFIKGVINNYGGLDDVIWMEEVIATCH